jgi:hypothetical protein
MRKLDFKELVYEFLNSDYLDCKKFLDDKKIIYDENFLERFINAIVTEYKKQNVEWKREGNQ